MAQQIRLVLPLIAACSLSACGRRDSPRKLPTGIAVVDDTADDIALRRANFQLASALLTSAKPRTERELLDVLARPATTCQVVGALRQCVWSFDLPPREPGTIVARIEDGAVIDVAVR